VFAWWLVAKPSLGYRWFFVHDRQYGEVRARAQQGERGYTDFSRVLFTMMAIALSVAAIVVLLRIVLL
jgi:hypothetical protein